MEKVMILWKGVDGTSEGMHNGHLANRLYDYASLLASQGYLATALNYLAPVTSDDVCHTNTSVVSSLRVRLLIIFVLIYCIYLPYLACRVIHFDHC